MDEHDGGWLTGRLLLASPSLEEPTFRRAVILLLDHDEGGALGVILNRPTDADLEAVLPGWSAVAAGPVTVFEGGPVGAEAALAVGVLEEGVEDEPLGWRPMYGRVGLVDLDAPVAAVEDALAGVRVFAGYAGWSPGQLEEELASGSWLVARSDDHDVLSPHPDDLWRGVLRRQDGELRLLASYPDDPSMN
ncbi:MAG: YqgE/AlgH family protein [Nocardioidaceae bacterium]|nr:YqgE/AlgH family protein [Nocardioidaceae bacterium]